jgi:hypothetical protein
MYVGFYEQNIINQTPHKTRFKEGSIFDQISNYTFLVHLKKHTQFNTKILKFHSNRKLFHRFAGQIQQNVIKQTPLKFNFRRGLFYDKLLNSDILGTLWNPS